MLDTIRLTEQPAGLETHRGEELLNLADGDKAVSESAVADGTRGFGGVVGQGRYRHRLAGGALQETVQAKGAPAERVLAATFPAYREYQSRTSRFIPGLI